MSCKVMRGGLKSSDRSGEPSAAASCKKRVHFFDDTKTSGREEDVTSRESKQDGAKAHQFGNGVQNLYAVFAKVTVNCDLDAQAAANFISKEGNSYTTAKDLKLQDSANLCIVDGICGIENDSPSTPPPPLCASYVDNMASHRHGVPHSQRHIVKGVQRKLTYVVEPRDRCHRRFGVANKALKSYKVVPEGELEGGLIMEYLQAQQDLNTLQMHASGEGPYCKKRCAWITPQSDPVYVAYHDEEWGVPVHEDRRLFELLVFAGAQAEMAWSALLAKREAYRNIFAQFEPTILATYDTTTVASLRSHSDIMRSEARVQSIISNAKLVTKIIEEYGSFDAYLWSFVGHKPIANGYKQAKLVPTRTGKSEAISKDLQRRGFRHSGPIVVYSLMQAAGLVNDHLISCFRHCALNILPSPSPSPSPRPVSLRKLPAKPLVTTPICC